MESRDKLILNFKIKRCAEVIVSGDSMLPYFHDGELVNVEPMSEKQSLAIGEVIVFEVNNHLVIHRIVDIVFANRHVFVKTKGDNNTQDDGFLHLSKVLGVVYEKMET